jgi:hypothetical protein
MTLYVHKLAAYVFDIAKDITIFPVDNKRYTMRDIGRIENRVKNLEYYTSLSLAEKDTQIFQIKDAQGFDRFKNGFIVDSFTGHGIGDPTNIDYAAAIDYNKNEARPLCETRFIEISEQAASSAARTANNYVLAGDLYTLPFTEEAFITNTKSSKSVNLNPFNVILFSGKITLNPPSDVWFSDTKVPNVYRDAQGNYDSLLADAKAKGKYGTVWGNWRDLRYGNSGNELIQQQEGIKYSVTETINTTTNNDIVVSKTVIPKMRDVIITFNAEGMKPNTRLFAYFNDVNVTNFLLQPLKTLSPTDVNWAANSLIAAASIGQPIVTDKTGNATGTFSYVANTFNFNTGKHIFRLTDSASNTVGDQETFAQAEFNSSGELRSIANEIISTRNATLDSTVVTQERTVVTTPAVVTNDTSYVDPGPTVPTTKTITTTLSIVETWYVAGIGRTGEPGGVAYWNNRLDSTSSPAEVKALAIEFAAAAISNNDIAGGLANNLFTLIGTGTGVDINSASTALGTVLASGGVLTVTKEVPV